MRRITIASLLTMMAAGTMLTFLGIVRQMGTTSVVLIVLGFFLVCLGMMVMLAASENGRRGTGCDE